MGKRKDMTSILLQHRRHPSYQLSHLGLDPLTELGLEELPIGTVLDDDTRPPAKKAKRGAVGRHCVAHAVEPDHLHRQEGSAAKIAADSLRVVALEQQALTGQG